MLMRQCALRVRGSELVGWTHVEIREALSDPYSRETAEAMLEVVRKQDLTVKSLEKTVLKRVKLIEPFDLLLTLPGVGNILGVTIMLETGPVERFASAGDYASYCRAVKSRRLSDGKKKGENNRKNGNKYLSWAWVEAANFAQRYHERPRVWFQRKMSRTKRVVATKALACKLCKAGYFILRDSVPYNEQKMFG
jgi:transposase